MSLREQTIFDFRKFLWNTLTFFSIIFLLGNLDRGANTFINFAWTFRQMELAKGSFDAVNLLSYPYYIFYLSGFLAGLLFFGNVYFIYKKAYKELFPFTIVMAQMFLFSFSQEKGLRYLCVVMPFIWVAVSLFIIYFWNNYRNYYFRIILCALAIFFIAHRVAKSWEVINFTTDYESSMADLRMEDANVKVLSTQYRLHQLFAQKRIFVLAVPNDFRYLIVLYLKGYRYLMIDPQAYISYTQDGKRFSLKLQNYLEFISRRIKPYKIYPHFSKALLERFVFEHNENLMQSIRFLRANQDGHLGQLRVYDIRECLEAVGVLERIQGLKLKLKSKKSNVNEKSDIF